MDENGFSFICLSVGKLNIIHDNANEEILCVYDTVNKHFDYKSDKLFIFIFIESPTMTYDTVQTRHFLHRNIVILYDPLHTHKKSMNFDFLNHFRLDFKLKNFKITHIEFAYPSGKE